MKILKFKWTISRGRDTYGYNICSLYVDDKKVASCSGGGYDMEGTVLGMWMEKEFYEELTTLTSNDYYGLYNDNLAIRLDGACGFNCMTRVLDALGYKLKRIDSSKNQTIYILEEVPDEMR